MDTPVRNSSRSGNLKRSMTIRKPILQVKSLEPLEMPSIKQLKTTFSLIRSTLLQREEELLSELEGNFNVHLSSALSFMKTMTSQFQQESDQYAEAREIIRQSEPFNIKINLPKEPLAQLDLAKGQVSFLPRQMEELLDSNLEVKCINSNEDAVRRSQITRALKWRYSGDAYDALTFTTSSNILLSAVGICTPYKQGEVTVVQEFRLKLGNSTSSPDLYVHNVQEHLKHNPRTSIQMIKLSTPISVPKNTKLTVILKIDGANTFKCVDCVNLVQGKQGVAWKFFNTVFSSRVSNNRCDVLCGPIAEFRYLIKKSKQLQESCIGQVKALIVQDITKNYYIDDGPYLRVFLSPYSMYYLKNTHFPKVWNIKYPEYFT